MKWTVATFFLIGVLTGFFIDDMAFYIVGTSFREIVISGKKCSIDGTTWWPARDDICYLADRP